MGTLTFVLSGAHLLRLSITKLIPPNAIWIPVRILNKIMSSSMIVALPVFFLVSNDVSAYHPSLSEYLLWRLLYSCRIRRLAVRLFLRLALDLPPWF